MKWRKLIRRILGRRKRKQAPPEAKQWLAGKDFSVDYVSSHIGVWRDILSGETVRDILEIGSLEGLSAIVWLELFPGSSITCIDTFEGTPIPPVDPKYRAQIPFREQRFDANLAAYGSRVRKIKGRSASALDALYHEGRTFDLIYVDADHRCSAVLADSALALQVLRHNGIIVWDDYRWRQSDDRPGPAIDAILSLYRKELKVLHKQRQVIARKHMER